MSFSVCCLIQKDLGDVPDMEESCLCNFIYVCDEKPNQDLR